MLKTIILVAIGGAAGSVLRYLTGFFVYRHFTTMIPVATLIVNVVGCFLMGLILGLLDKHHVEDLSLRWLLITGFCGGYTTFSTFSNENIILFQTGNAGLAFVNIAGNVIVGLAAVWLGLFVSQ